MVNPETGQEPSGKKSQSNIREGYRLNTTKYVLKWPKKH